MWSQSFGSTHLQENGGLQIHQENSPLIFYKLLHIDVCQLI